MIRHFALFVSILLVPWAALAQEKEDGGIQIRLFAFAHSGKIDRLRFGGSDAKSTEHPLPLDGFSEPVVVASRTIDYGVPAKEFVPLGQIVLPDIGKKFVVIFAPTSDGYRTFPVRIDDPEFKGDDAILFNFSPIDVGVELGSAKQIIRSMKIGKLRPAAAAGARFFQATFYQQGENGPVIFNNTRWPSSDRLRVFAFVFKDPVTGNMTYRDMRY